MNKHRRQQCIWENDELDPQTLGPVEIPWDLQEFGFNPDVGTIFRIKVNFILNTSNKTVSYSSDKYKNANVSSNGDGYFHTPTQSPVFSFAKAKEIWEYSREQECSLVEAFQAVMTDLKDNVSPKYLRQLPHTPEVYPTELAEALDVRYGIIVDLDSRIERARSKNAALKAKAELEVLEKENAELEAKLKPKERIRKRTVPALKEE